MPCQIRQVSLAKLWDAMPKVAFQLGLRQGTAIAEAEFGSVNLMVEDSSGLGRHQCANVHRVQQGCGASVSATLTAERG